MFEENQYLGRNRYWLNMRLVLAAFCYAAYFYTQDKEIDGQLFLVVGTAILIISAILFFVIHFKTIVYSNCIVLDGLWSTRKVKIDMNSIVSAEKASYSNFMLNNPVYNLHKKGTIRFYTRGHEAVKLTDRDGLVYMIGSQHPDRLAAIIQEQLNKK